MLRPPLLTQPALKILVCQGGVRQRYNRMSRSPHLSDPYGAPGRTTLPSHLIPPHLSEYCRVAGAGQTVSYGRRMTKLCRVAIPARRSRTPVEPVLLSDRVCSRCWRSAVVSWIHCKTCSVDGRWWLSAKVLTDDNRTFVVRALPILSDLYSYCWDGRCVFGQCPSNCQLTCFCHPQYVLYHCRCGSRTGGLGLA